MANKILVTGGAGFIGSALVWELNQRGVKNIWVSDYLGKDLRYQNLVPLVFEEYLEADSLLEKIKGNDPVLKEIGLVYHLGACSRTTQTDCRYLIQNNYEYTKSLAHWAIDNGKRFIYASSAATYGDGSLGMEDDESSLQTLRPLNMYAYSKHLFDLYAKAQGWLEGGRNGIVGLKYFNVFGPNEGHKGDMCSLVYKAFHQIQKEGKISLFKSYHPNFKDGEQMRDFLYVKDAICMTLFLGESEASGIFNLGSGVAHTWLDLVSAIFKALNKAPSIEFIEMPDSLKPKYQYFTKANIQKLLSLGYAKNNIERRTSLEESVRDYVQNYLLKNAHLG